LNKIGEQIGKISGVHAMTDVTGFGLLGHLIEMAEGSGLSANLGYAAVPIIPIAKELAVQRIVPDATYRNWNSCGSKTDFAPGVNVMEAFNILPDPQTNGGLLIAVAPEAAEELKALLIQEGYSEFLQPIGMMTTKVEKVVMVA
ncbi:MAG: AIR synthase-related protein, partial [Chitinophagaceae bacterium]